MGDLPAASSLEPCAHANQDCSSDRAVGVGIKRQVAVLHVRRIVIEDVLHVEREGQVFDKGDRLFQRIAQGQVELRVRRHILNWGDRVIVIATVLTDEHRAREASYFRADLGTSDEGSRIVDRVQHITQGLAGNDRAIEGENLRRIHTYPPGAPILEALVAADKLQPVRLVRAQVDLAAIDDDGGFKFKRGRRTTEQPLCDDRVQLGIGRIEVHNRGQLGQLQRQQVVASGDFRRL